ncbi:hypothetical protein [Amaricoccus solimangrovi]|uniref:Cadherin domain-containing protein n=1 Tax=Amaricoccus solimangrovi TaxID=2589815 RepID=A0A501WL78_9RHOB|nr:hypothetical protein [Amaricoccus solimangrovi]TPE49150.1 hypothetical protein FJM51_15885 [Amaricoccus solimangrovi]
MMLKLTGDYGYSAWSLPKGSDTVDVIDATQASWIEANIGETLNLYPFRVAGGRSGLVIHGGAILGEVPLDTDWTVTYVNSAGVRVQDTPGVVIDGWRISRPWDGIRVVGASDGFTITDVRVSDSRDDAVENDDALSGTIADSLFDGVFSGISLGDGDVDGSDNTVTLDGVLLRSKSFLYKGEITHGSPFKLDKGTPDITPHLRIHDSVIAIEDVDHAGQERLAKAWEKTVESSGNYFLNLSDDPLPSDYPRPGAGWTILQGQRARDFWAGKKDAWIAAHDGDDGTAGGDSPVAFAAEADSDSRPDRIEAAAAAGTSVGVTATAADPDAGDSVRYALNDARFAIDTGGRITRSGQGTLDAALEPTIRLKVTATSTDGSVATRDFAIAVVAGETTTAHVTQARIATDADDAEESPSGSVSLGSGDLELGQDGSKAQVVGIRFGGLDIPEDAVITRAYLRFTVDESGAGASNLVIRGVDADTAPKFTTAAQDLSSRPLTDTSTGWKPADWPSVGASGAAQKSPDISAIVQEIVDRAGWAPGNALALTISGTGERVAVSHDGDPAAAPVLRLEWESATPMREGSAGADTLTGTGAADFLRGLAGDDLLLGKAGTDTLSGGPGKDAFLLDGAGGLDTIADFVTREDRIYLDHAAFAKLGSGTLANPRALSSSYFETGAPDDGNDYVIYDTESGLLSYDPDGSGAGEAVEIARLGAGLALSYKDMFII